MPIIEQPPQYKTQRTYEDFSKIWEIRQIPELQKLIHKASDQYLYWTDVKHQIPKEINVDPESLWAYIKLGRNVNRRITPVKDKEGDHFFYWTPDCLLRSISEVDKWSGGVLTTDEPVGLPEKERYIINSLMDEAIASSQLEGASTEYKVAKELLRTGRKPIDKNEQMIVNNWEAMQFIRENTQKPFSLAKIKQLHSILTKSTLDDPRDCGNLRQHDEIEIRYRGEVIFIPPKASELEKRVLKLCEFAGIEKEEHWIHPVIKGAMIHFWLAYDHPFVDGNGRTARALMYWYLLRRGYSLFQYLSISKHFIKAPGRYVRAYLHSENDENDLTYFLVYNLSSIRQALNELREYIKAKQNEIVKANSLLYSFKGLNIRQKSLIYHSIQHPSFVYTIRGHKNTHGIAYDTARKDLLVLAKKGFLQKKKEAKKLLVFTPSDKTVQRLREK